MQHTPDIGTLSKALPLPQSDYQKLVDRQNVFDIVRHALQMHRECGEDYDLISENFWKGNEWDTCACIFDFCKKNIPYEVEPAKKQTVKSPGQILYDAGQSGIPQDCKHYALFCCGIIDSLRRKGYPIKCNYRFASDVKTEKYPKHVFCVVQSPDGEIWLDPVLSELNQDHPYFYFLNKQCPMLYKVSGVSDNAVVCGFGAAYIPGEAGEIGKHGAGKNKLKNLLKKAGHGIEVSVHDAGKGIKKVEHGLAVNVQNAGKEIKKIQPGKLLVKVGMIPSRNAFLLLLKLNAFDLAYNLFKHAQSPAGRDAIKRLWDKVGGKWGNLTRDINQGMRVYMHNRNKPMPEGWHTISGYFQQDDINMFPDGAFVGVAAAAGVAATVAAAMPIIKVFQDLLKSLGVDFTKIKKTADGGSEVLSINHNNSEDGSHSDSTETHVTTDSKGNQILSIDKFQGNEHEDGEHAGVIPGTNIPFAPGAAPTPASYANDQYGGDDGSGDAPGNAPEIPAPHSGTDKAVNVITDWGRGVGNWIRDNKGLATTGIVVIGLMTISKSPIFGKHKKR